MKSISISGKTYTLEFSFEAAEYKNIIQGMFNIVSGAYIIKNGRKDEMVVNAVVNGTSEMVADIPGICRNAFYAGLLEHNAATEEEAKSLMKQYMRENKLSFSKLYEELKQCMEDDGFFDLTGITEMVEKMNQSMETGINANINTGAAKVPKDHRAKEKKQTSMN